MDLPVPTVPYPERPFGPREPRVAAATGRRDRGEHMAGLRIDLLDAILGELKQVLAVEGRSRMRGDIDRAQRLPARRIQRVQLVSGSEPDLLTDGEPARGRTTAPCLLPRASRAPAAPCAGSFRARAPGPSSTTTHRRRGRRAPPHAPLRQAAPARRPRLRGAEPAQTLASSRPRRPASEASCEAARLLRATARDATRRHASLRRLVQRACPALRAPAHRVEGTSPCLLPGGTGARPYVAGGRRHGLAARFAPRPALHLLLCRPDGDPPRHRSHGPARDGCRGGRHHPRTSRDGR